MLERPSAARVRACHIGMVSGPQSWSVMKIASNCAGSVALAFSAKRWIAPGGSNHVCPAEYEWIGSPESWEFNVPVRTIAVTEPG